MPFSVLCLLLQLLYSGGRHGVRHRRVFNSGGCERGHRRPGARVQPAGYARGWWTVPVLVPRGGDGWVTPRNYNRCDHVNDKDGAKEGAGHPVDAPQRVEGEGESGMHVCERQLRIPRS